SRDIRARESSFYQEMPHREHPIEMAVEHGVAGGAGISGQRGHDHLALLGQFVEEWDPARQAAETREEAELRAATLAPDPAGQAVDLDGRCGGDGHDRRRLNRRRRWPGAGMAAAPHAAFAPEAAATNGPPIPRKGL